ncbi:cytochrome P450, partial [Streptomyces mirabilis]|uniref:cytochrome P450 n=1 Tax=Streptomyces mirabilis TaxID=68239 RepID=UPI003676EA3C
DRPEEFDINRWLPENRVNHHPHAYKPFGNGVLVAGRQNPASSVAAHMIRSGEGNHADGRRSGPYSAAQ